MVELADSLDSGSSVHSGRAGSTPASRTKPLKSSDLRGFSTLRRLQGSLDRAIFEIETEAETLNNYITGAMIKELREQKKMTQGKLAEKLSVSDKTVSKWETGKGYPDISLIEPLSAALGISVIELLSGVNVNNHNRSGNMKKVKFYVCPICGNVLFSIGEAVISCCGVTLPALEAERPDDSHDIQVEVVEDEYYILLSHEMSKTHSISFLAAVRDNGVEMIKLYPEHNAEARFKINRTGKIYWYCNRHGLFSTEIRDSKK